MKSECQKRVISKIKEVRVFKGKGQKFLASELNVSCGLIGCIESDNTPHKYTLAQIYRLCQALDISISEVFSVDNNISDANELLTATIEKIIEYEG